ncbi:MAG: secondary thiamine-phosphate synthase enzyme YjbQ [Candidatus Lernaella stagnicola]|nr:secondary thiamine-phosphate synthase enzyme YjbQ [Candidatus Lernaella stagnicola]
MLKKITVRTTAREQFIDITDDVRDAVREFALRDGVVTVFVPHTTAAVTINENADPTVVSDILLALDKAVPDQRAFRHAEGNSTAHVKSSLVGCSQDMIVAEGRLLLGTWQGVYFCEFDGPRARSCYIKAT